MKFSQSVILRLSLLPIVIIFLAPVAFAQSADTGAIFGTFSDKTGAFLPSAKVVLTDQRTGVTSTHTTNNSGFYDIEALPSSDYSVSVQKDGFESTSIQNIHLDPGQRREVSAKLQVGSTTTSLTVEANTLQVQTETSDDSSTIDSKEISTLLVNGRNFQALATLNPGVNNTNGNNQYTGGGLTSTTTLSVGGTGVDDTTYSLDGTYNMNTGNYINLNISPSLDVISSFTMLKSNYSARYGTASNSTVLVDTKSGTSTYHGSGWDYLRNSAMDASEYYSQGVKTALHQNIFGFSLGGPLQIPKLYNWDRKKKTFFFASDEWWANSSSSTNTAWVITKAMRAGNLAGSIGMPAGGLSLTPQGQSFLAAEGKTNCITSPTTLNPSCFDTDAMAMLTAYQPTENISNINFNYVNYNPSTYSSIDHDYRVDHEFTPSETLTGRVNYEQTNVSYGSANPIALSEFTSGLNAMVRQTSTFGSNIVNTASFADTFDKPRLHDSAAPIPAGVNIAYYYPNVTEGLVPNVSIGGYEGWGTGPYPINASDGEGIIDDDFSIVRGKHTLQAGAFYIYGIKNQITGNEPQGSFSFGGTYTGSGAADYLLGLHDGFEQDSLKPHYTVHYRQTEYYVQDDWKATPKLTINAGIRFFYYSPDWLTGPFSETSNFVLADFNPADAPEVQPDGSFVTNASGVPITSSGTIANLDNGLVFNTTPGVPRGFYHNSRQHPAPRLGFAYALGNDNKTSIFAGYGVGYTRVPFMITNPLTSNPPGVANVHFISGTIEDPEAGVLQPTVPSPQAIQMVDTNFAPSQIQNYSITFQHEVVRDGIFQIGYQGSESRHLPIDTDQNQIMPTSTPSLPNCLAPGQTPSAVYDYDPCINTNTISSDYIRPRKGYDSQDEFVYESNANYNSLQSQFRLKRKSWETTLNYTWGKALGDNSSGANYRSSYSGDQNSYCLKCEYGPRNFNRPQIFTGNVIYAVPFHGGNNLISEFLGGWSVSGIAIVQSGMPQTPGLSAPNTGMAARPDVVGPLHFSNNRNEIFNPDAYAIPAYGFFGTAGVGSIPGPKDVAFNTALYKTFPIRDRLNFQFRAEAFNAVNHPNFQGVDTGIGPDDPTPGLVNSPADPRILEMVGRFTF
jgi:Carboxypeptidase regulatory-like domain